MQKIIYSPEIYTYQIDFNHHVSNIVYIEWMEIGRLKLLQAAGLDIQTLARSEVTPVLLQTHITYRKPLILGDHLTIEMWIGALRKASAELIFNFYKNGHTLAAEATQTGLFLNSVNLRPHRLNPEERLRFLPYTA